MTNEAYRKTFWDAADRYEEAVDNGDWTSALQAADEASVAAEAVSSTDHPSHGSDEAAIHARWLARSDLRHPRGRRQPAPAGQRAAKR